MCVWLSSWAMTGPHTGNSVSAPEHLHQVPAGTARLVHPDLWGNFSVTGNLMVPLGNLARNIHALGQFRGMAQLKTRASPRVGLCCYQVSSTPSCTREAGIMSVY